MSVSRSVLIVMMALVGSQIYAGPSVITAINGITITAQVMSYRDGKMTFGQDMRTQRVFPISLCLRNEKKQPLSFSIRSSAVPSAEILTRQSLNSSISVASGFGTVMMLVFFPVGLYALWYVTKLKELLGIVEKWSMDQAVIIEPGQCYQTYLFPQFPRPPAEYLKDEQGNRLCDDNGKPLPGSSPDFVAPESMDLTINFVVDRSWFASSVTFSLLV